jgi:hypothetical protein
LRANIALSVRPRPQAPALNPEAIELTVTMPLLPSYLEKELAATLRRPGGFLTTSAAFTRLAQTASRGLVVMTPFIDAGGFRWLRRLFETTSVDCQKIVVLRDTDRYMVELGVQHADWLRALQVSVRDYHLSHICQALGIMPTKKYIRTKVGRALSISSTSCEPIRRIATLISIHSASLLASTG